MRICSLIPSATEFVGKGGTVRIITEEGDTP